MSASLIIKQVDTYLPLLSAKQQVLVLELIKSFLNVDQGSGRITKKQYNRELDEAVARIENGSSVTHKSALDELSKW